MSVLRRTRRTPGLLATASAVSVLAVGLAGCGSDESPADAGAGSSVVASPSEEAAPSGTAEPSPASSSEPAATAEPVSPPASAPAADEASGDGFVDAMAQAMRAAGSAEFSTSTSTGGQTIGSEGAFRYGEGDDGYAARFTMRVPGEESGSQEISATLDGSTIYLKLPEEDAPAGKAWLKISAEDDNPMAQGLRPMFDQMEQSIDPSASLALLGGDSALDAAGQEQVGGVATTKYVTTVDLQEAAKSAEGSNAQQYDALLTAGIESLDYAVWVDDKGLPRRFSATFETPQGPVTSEGTYSSWGEDVDVSVPPADQVTTFDELQ